MYDTMIAAAQSNTKFVVLDRPNPITGLNAFGPVLNESVASYVGRRGIAQAHGMTAGELAKMFVGEQWIKEASNGYDLSLDVIKMKGWKRSMAWEDTGLPWVMPSPSTKEPLSHISQYYHLGHTSNKRYMDRYANSRYCSHLSRSRYV